MLLEYITQYYSWLWLALVAIGFLKIIFAHSFLDNLEGVNGVLYSLFKWFGEDEQEREDVSSRRTQMRFYNIMTFFLYLLIVLILVSSLLLRILAPVKNIN